MRKFSFVQKNLFFVPNTGSVLVTVRAARKTSAPKNWQVLGNMSPETGVTSGYNWRKHRVLVRVKDIRVR